MALPAATRPAPALRRWAGAGQVRPGPHVGSRVSAQQHSIVNSLPFQGIFSFSSCLTSSHRALFLHVVLVKMDPDVRKLVILLIYQLSLFTTLECICTEKEMILIWHWQQLDCLTLAFFGPKLCNGRYQRRLLAHDQGLHKPGFFDQNLLSSFNAREFKGGMCMDVSTFEYLCSTLVPDL